ncbi:elongation factor EF-2 [Candidatus Woesearchaeota archaeon]|nr:elongation factor EF-2 [Candidatus Woesearchaeota archaeon]
MAERMADKVARITKDPRYIRNICTSAHIHHGKCIAGGSRVILPEGIFTAKEIYERIAQEGQIIEENDSHIVYAPKKTIYSYSLNKETGKIEQKPIQYAWKLQGGSTIKVSLRNGFEISTTPEHKYIVQKDGFEEIEAKDLKIDDHIACATNILYFWEEKNVAIEPYQYIPVSIKNGSQIGVQYTKSPYQDLAFVEITKIESGYEDIVYDLTIPDNHNFIAEGMVIHNTAFTDNLLAASGHMASKNAGDLEEGMTTWQHADEQERLMTVDAANVSMVHEFGGNEFLINLIDTPGHIDFGGNVTRAMRAIDGTVVLICAVEGIMPQTETVVKQALRERVKPVLFINKVDRLVKELQLSPEKIQERFIKLINDFNQLVENIAEPEYKEIWKVNIKDGSVAFGSARENWALSFPYMQKKNISFKDILRIYEMDEEKRKAWVWDNASLHEVILDMVIKHHPNPIVAQKYRIPRIWKGELESEFGQDLVNCNPNGKLAFVITRIVIDPKSGKDISAGRLFSGTLKPGTQIYLNNAKETQRIQNLYIYNGIKPELLDFIPAGNVCAISGIVGYAGETITLEAEQPFEALKYIFEPVITKAIEVKKMADLPKLVEVLRKVGREDPSIKIEINEETGENLISGMGELHLEIVENRIVTEKGVEVKTSQPIVVYRESIQKKSAEFEGKSPNKHNKLYFVVEPLEDEIYQSIKSGEISEGRVRKKDTIIAEKLIQLGVETKEAKSYVDVFNGNVLIDNTRGIVYINEIMGLVMDGFEDVMKRGTLAGEPGMKMKIRLMDCSLHEDAIHRGPSQMLPAVREGMRLAIADAKPVILEPLQVMQIEAPVEFMGEVSKLVQNKRGQLLSMDQEGVNLVVKAILPVAEMIGWASDLRSGTAGRGSSFIVDQKFDKVPESIQPKVIQQIRKRKGLADNQ